MRITFTNVALFRILALFVFASCSHSKIIDDTERLNPEKGKNINLMINVPRSGSSTYSTETGSVDENHVNKLFIKIFEDGVHKETKEFSGASLKVLENSNDSIVNVDFEIDNLTGGTVTAEVFANRMEITPITGEIPLPNKSIPETLFMMSGSGILSHNGTSYKGTVHIARNVAKLRILVSKNTTCIPEDLIIDYSDIIVEVQQVPDRTQLLAPPPIVTPAGINYINYTPRTGMALRPTTPFASFTGGQIDSLYLNENYLDNNAYASVNKTQIKITMPTHEPNMPVKTAEYTYDLYSKDGFMIKRNFIYTLSIKVTGQSLDPLVSLDILPWKNVNIDGNINGSTLSLDKSKVSIKSANIGNKTEVISYKTDNSSISLDWSNIKPEYNIDTSVDFIQGTEGYINILWNDKGAPDFDFKDTLFVHAGNIIKAVIINHKVPKGNFGNWVGTFHRWNQTGERIIKMRNVGEWTAMVTQGADFIIMDTEDTGDDNMGTSSATLGNSNNFDINHPINGNSVALSGKGIIYFRVGMKNTLTQMDEPPRYGLIEITTNDGTKKIYVRQGEEADYVMRPEEPNSANGDRPRTYAAQFSPFNLTDPGKGTGGNDIDMHNDVVFGENNFIANKFTEYPSQAGYFFQWNLGVGKSGKVFNPVNTINSITEWSNGAKTSWNINMEPCPQGYYHPNDNKQNPVNSEIRQSWYVNPNSDIYGSNHPQSTAPDNSVWGFYADGFFDRLPVVASPNGTDSTTVSFNPASLSSTENTQVAYAGLLIYNPNTYASIFLPAAGIRNSTTGALEFAGERGGYWTDTRNGNNGIAFFFTPTSSYLFNNAHQSNGASVRCVKSDFGLPGSM